MHFRKLTQIEEEFIKLNPEIIEIQYYPRYAKKHRCGVSVFKVNKGFAFIFSKKILTKFKKCQIIDVIEHTVSRKDIHYASIKEAILGA